MVLIVGKLIASSLSPLIPEMSRTSSTSSFAVSGDFSFGRITDHQRQDDGSQIELGYSWFPLRSLPWGVAKDYDLAGVFGPHREFPVGRLTKFRYLRFRNRR